MIETGMTVGGWPLAGKAHIGHDHSLAQLSRPVGMSAPWNVMAACLWAPIRMRMCAPDAPGQAEGTREGFSAARLTP
jgi:hypothetical protein